MKRILNIGLSCMVAIALVGCADSVVDDNTIAAQDEQSDALGKGKPGSGTSTITWVTLDNSRGFSNPIIEDAGEEGGLVVGGYTFALDVNSNSSSTTGNAASASCTTAGVQIGLIEVLKKGKQLTTVIVRGYGNGAEFSSDRLPFGPQATETSDFTVDFNLPSIDLYPGNGGGSGGAAVCTVSLDKADYDYGVTP